MVRSVSTPRRRRRLGGRFYPLLLVVAALVALTGGLSFGGVAGRVLSSRRVQAVLAAVPQPWRPPRPAYVPPPDAPLAPQPAVAVPESAAASVPLPAEETTAPPAGAAGAVPPPVALAAPASALLQGFRHEWQTWNNCGPATIAMATSHFGRTEAQAHAAAFLKPNPNDKNVSHEELVAYVRSVGLEAERRVGGDLDRLKLLLAHGVPVVTPIWITPAPNDGLGHYRLLIGYDDATGRLTAYDSFVAPGVNLVVPYGQFDDEWRVANRVYLPIYSADKADLVARILGPDRDDRQMYERALAVAQREAAARPEDAFAWFNVGSNLTALDRAAEAAAAFDRARSLRLPWRMLWYQLAPFEAYLAEGRTADVLRLADANLAQAADLEESQYYRGRALQMQGQVTAARAAYQAALRVNSKYLPAYEALSSLS